VMTIYIYLSLHILIGIVAGVWFAVQRRSLITSSSFRKGVVFLLGLVACLGLVAVIGEMQSNPSIQDGHRYLGSVLVMMAAVGTAYAGMKFRRPS